MHPSKCVPNPVINDTFFDPDNIKLYKYKKLGDYPPEWINITPDIDTDKPIEGFY